MTAHYNGYFNAKEIIKQSLYSFREGYKEDYTQVLPIFVYPDEEEAANMLTPMEEAIKKTSVVIAKHSMPDPEEVRNKKEEWCKWIDDNWLVMGQAYFYKNEFKSALEKFKYIENTYPDKSIVYHARLWMAKTYLETDKFAEARSILELMEETIKEQKDERRKLKKLHREKRKTRRQGRKVREVPPAIFPKDLQEDVVIVFADLHLRKQEYRQASERLIEAINLARNRKLQARLYFILAQIHQKMDDNAAASNYYDKVLQKSASYEMNFYAKINRALMYSGRNTRGIKAELLKMAKDEKNKEFLDQIYYALGELDLKDRNREEAINYFVMSAQKSVDNIKQQVKTYKRLGDLYYEDKNFPKAKVYYDSTMAVLPNDAEDYDEIESRSIGLTDLVQNLEEANFQDSVLSLVEKGEKAYLKVIDGLIEDYKLKKEQEREARQSGGYMPSNGRQNDRNMASDGKWYFYNEALKSRGIAEFKQVWGDRKLEDNWRRKDKSTFNAGIGDNDTLSGENIAAENNPKSRAYYLKNLPLEEEDQEEAREKLANAWYNVGVIYKERLNELQRGINSFHKVIDRFGEDLLSLPSYFQLYLINKHEGNPTLTEKYKSLILDEFPDSEYAKLIKNPDFKKEQKKKAQKHEKEYASIYQNYQDGNYTETFNRIDQIERRTEPNSFMPKYLLLKAYALAQTKGRTLDVVEDPLTAITKSYPETEEAKLAQSILNRLKNQESIKNAKKGLSNFVYNTNMQHFFVLLFPANQGKSNKAEKDVSDFNNSSFDSRNLKTKSIPLKNIYLIQVKAFPNKKAAMQYYKAFKNDNRMKRYSNMDYFVITHQNYSAMYLEKNFEDYKAFFKDNYLQ